MSNCAQCGAEIEPERGRFARFCSRHAAPVKVSPRQAIRAKCKDCIYDPLAGGTWLEQVAQCSIKDCPLWDFRPMPKSRRGK